MIYIFPPSSLYSLLWEGIREENSQGDHQSVNAERFHKRQSLKQQHSTDLTFRIGLSCKYPLHSEASSITLTDPWPGWLLLPLIYLRLRLLSPATRGSMGLAGSIRSCDWRLWWCIHWWPSGSELEGDLIMHSEYLFIQTLLTYWFRWVDWPML